MAVAFATCPLPPKQNRLPVRVEAVGKRATSGHDAPIGSVHVHDGYARLGSRLVTSEVTEGCEQK